MLFETFLILGAIGCFWYVLWIIFIYETPDEHPTISKEELLLIYESEENQISQRVRCTVFILMHIISFLKAINNIIDVFMFC